MHGHAMNLLAVFENAATRDTRNLFFLSASPKESVFEFDWALARFRGESPFRQAFCTVLVNRPFILVEFRVNSVSTFSSCLRVRVLLPVSPRRIDIGGLMVLPVAWSICTVVV